MEEEKHVIVTEPYIKRVLHRMRSRGFGLALVWILFVLAGYGTFILSKNLETKGNNSASIFMAKGKIHEIGLYDSHAEPAELTVKQGDEVVFKIKDNSHHNIAESRARKIDARIESGELSQDESYSLVFNTKGEMSFYDRMNQDIQIRIFIKE